MSHEKIVNWALPHVKQFRTYVDVGANTGGTSVPFVEQFDRIICFEPNPNSFKELSSNTNLECYNIALGDISKSAKLTMNNITNNPEHGSIHEGRTKEWTGETFSVQVKTLDSFKLDNVDFIKIDTEMYEYFVVKGAVKTIKKNRPVILFENKRNEADNAILFLLDIGYTVRKWKSDTVAYYQET